MNGPAPISFVIATAGHIDHGKTTLVRALTGIDTDRLPEEKRRGITIDLGYASMQLEQPGARPLRVSFVDVPGHALFIRNMLAGAGCVPAVLLVIAADEGIKPQTVEHFSICRLLGINQGIVAITKCDAVGQQHIGEVIENVRALVENTFLRDAPLLPVSARTGAGLTSLRAELLNLAVRIHAADCEAFPRLPIDRAFVMKGFGTVVTGTLLSGVLRENQNLLLEPGARTVRVRGLQSHSQAEQAVSAGTRVAVNLSGIDVSEVHRGQTLLAPDSLSPISVFDAEIQLLSTAPPLKQGARVHFHAFTSEGMASISFYASNDVRPGDSRLGRIRLDHPVVLAPGDRFVLRQPMPVATIGGGRVLDCHPLPRQRKVSTASWLEQIRNADLPQQLVLRVSRRGTAGISAAALAREAGLAKEAAARHLESAGNAPEIASASGLFITAESLQLAAIQVMNLLERLVAQSGEAGVKSSELRGQALLSPAIFDFVIADLVREGKLRTQGESVSMPAGPMASAHGSTQSAAVAQAYQTAGLAAPLVPELAQRFKLSEAEIRRVVTLLQRQKVIVRMGSDDLFMHASALDGLGARMAALRGKLIDVAAFKQLTGLSRKYAIPLLEYLDHTRITRKQGDKRLVL